MKKKESCQTENKQVSSCSITDKGCKTSNSKEHLGEYWCAMYTDVDITKLGWYEDESTPSLQLIENSKVAKNAAILNVGAGSTTLIDSLVEKGYTHLIANDISSCALNKIKHRIGAKQEEVTWIVDDLVNPTELKKMPQVDVWNDRAVLHFFVDERDQDAYFELVNQKVKKNGFVILAVFNLEGATMCSGLPVKRYDAKMLQEKLGKGYLLKESFNYIYTMPNGDDRNYVYTLFQKIN
jgi:cyclopropane fatty-acyl-phospholipid synthase-like methyltransferase